MFFVYVIKNNKGKLYIGQTSNISQRLLDHNSGKSLYTKRSKTWVLVYKEICNTRSEAMLREKFLKTGKGRDFIKKILAVGT